MWGSPLPAVVRVRAPGGAAGMDRHLAPLSRPPWRLFFSPFMPLFLIWPLPLGGEAGAAGRGAGGRATQAANPNPLHLPVLATGLRQFSLLLQHRGNGSSHPRRPVLQWSNTGNCVSSSARQGFDGPGQRQSKGPFIGPWVADNVRLRFSLV